MLLFGILLILNTKKDFMTNENLPAWLVCEEIFSKLKTELITEAMDTLDEAVEAKIIDIKGSLINLPDKPSDTEMKVFVINRLIEEKDKIIGMYTSNISDEKEEMSAAKIHQRERLDRFLLYIEKISMLMHYSGLLDEWLNEISMEVIEKDPSHIIKKTMGNEKSREDLLGYVLKSNTIIKEEILTAHEREILEKAAQQNE